MNSYSTSYLVILILFLSQGCGLLKRKGTWGKNALYPIRGERIIAAAKKNVSSAHVWAPLLGAGIFAGLNLDQNFSDWVYNEGHVFKDADAADAWSDHFNNILKLEMYSVVILTPSYDEDKSFGKYLESKARGGLTVGIASSSSRFASNLIKETVNRQRPNKEDLKSFPSGHATQAGSRRVLVTKGMESIDMSSDLRFGINTLNTTIAVGTMWARIEGKRHYPSDVLFGYALGSFVSGFVYDSLINMDPNENFVLIPMGDRISAHYAYLF